MMTDDEKNKITERYKANQRAFEKRQLARGFKRLENIWVHPDDELQTRIFIRNLRKARDQTSTTSKP